MRALRERPSAVPSCSCATLARGKLVSSAPPSARQPPCRRSCQAVGRPLEAVLQASQPGTDDHQRRSSTEKKLAQASRRLPSPYPPAASIRARPRGEGGRASVLLTGPPLAISCQREVAAEGDRRSLVLRLVRRGEANGPHLCYPLAIHLGLEEAGTLRHDASGVVMEALLLSFGGGEMLLCLSSVHGVASSNRADIKLCVLPLLSFFWLLLLVSALIA